MLRRLRRRKQQGDNKVYFGMMGDVAMVNGRAYEIRPDGLHQLPIHPLRGIKLPENDEQVSKNAGQYKKDIS